MYNRNNNNRPGRDLPFYFTSSISSVLLFIFFKIRVQLVVRLGMCSVESITLAKVKSSTSSIDKLNLERSLAVCQPRPLGLLGIFKMMSRFCRDSNPPVSAGNLPFLGIISALPFSLQNLPFFCFFRKRVKFVILIL